MVVVKLYIIIDGSPRIVLLGTRIYLSYFFTSTLSGETKVCKKTDKLSIFMRSRPFNFVFIAAFAGSKHSPSIISMSKSYSWGIKSGLVSTKLFTITKLIVNIINFLLFPPPSSGSSTLRLDIYYILYIYNIFRCIMHIFRH